MQCFMSAQPHQAPVSQWANLIYACLSSGFVHGNLFSTHTIKSLPLLLKLKVYLLLATEPLLTVPALRFPEHQSS
jgi:hypothetical protein